MPKDMYRWETLKNGHYGWHTYSPEYARLAKSNDALKDEISKKVQQIVGDDSCNVSLVLSQGTITIQKGKRTHDQMARIKNQITECLGERFAGVDDQLYGSLIYFYGTDPFPYYSEWENRTGYQKA